MPEERIGQLEGKSKEIIWNQVQKVQRVEKYGRKSRRHSRHSELYPTFHLNPKGRGKIKRRSHI